MLKIKTMNFTIRKIEQKDNAELASIIRSCFIDFNVCGTGTVFEDPTTDHLYEFFQTERAVLFVAEENGKLLGSAGIFPTEGLPENCAEFVKFYLHKNARGKGIGKALLEKSLFTAKEMGYIQIYLESKKEFSTSISIYEKQGFRLLDAPMGNSGHSGCEIWMLKDIIDE